MPNPTHFTSHGVHYELDHHGVLNQLDPKPFTYDEAYVACYDGPEYRAQSDLLMALRLGFVIGVLGGIPTRLVDYGCGNGAFCKFAQKLVPRVTGLDVTGRRIKGVDVISQVGSRDSVYFDVFTFWDVLEHLPSLEFLRYIPTDHLVLSLPYCHYVTKGEGWFSDKYRHRKPNEHVRHFTPYSLRSVMEELGWRQVAMSTHEDIVRKSTYGGELPNILSAAFQRIV